MKMSAVLSAVLVGVATVGAGAQQKVSDAQIAAIVVTANQVDIDAGKVAEQKGSNPSVKAFGKQMVTDHMGVNKAASDLAGKLKLKPEENETSRSLAEAGKKNVAALQKLEGAAFDKAYIDNEIAYHQQVLDALDKTLIPNATNADLKALLTKTRPAFVAHLEHAKLVQSKLK
jgi:putative membrane protein